MASMRRRSCRGCSRRSPVTRLTSCWVPGCERPPCRGGGAAPTGSPPRSPPASAASRSPMRRRASGRSRGPSPTLTLHRPLRATRRPDGAFQLDGTPTDCVMLALGALMPEKPDFVISGINHGQNMGEDVFYSGTVAAAMEGLVAGVPSIAVSYAGADLDLLDTHKPGLTGLLRRITQVKDFPKETLLNINLPGIPGDQVKGVKVTHLGSRVFSEEIALMKDPWGKEIYWIGGGRITWTGGTESDFRATGDGYISVTPLHMDMTNYKLIEVVRSWLAGD